MEKLAKNVDEFIDKVSCEISKFYMDDFQVNMYNECMEYGCDDVMKSPIEHLLYIALNAVRIFNNIDSGDFIYRNHGDYSAGILIGLHITPQKKIGNYRCDFLIQYTNRISYNDKDEKKKIKRVIVECDSQEWHERTEKERRYEKARDRYFIKEGYKIFHYTGSEIVKNPMEIAKEIISYTTGINEDDIMVDSNCGEINGANNV